MKRKKRVAIVFGGQSTEHEVSLKSATTIISNINKERYDLVLVGITKKGQWLLYEGSVDNIASGEWENIAINNYKRMKVLNKHINSVREIFYKIGAETDDNPIDVAILAVHGNNCEDGTLQGVLELSGIPYVGPGVLASSVCMDKVFAKIMFEKEGLPVCKYLYFMRDYIKNNESEVISKVKDYLGYPCFVKPANAGSSVGVSKAYNDDELKKAFIEAALYDKKILVEEFVDAREIECAVLGNDDPKVAVVGEAISGGDFYDYDSKYKSQESRTEIPANIDKDKSDLIREYAKRAFLALNCEGLSRVDFFVKKKTGDIFINEINTLPGFTNISMYPMMWEKTGLSLENLIDKLIELSVERFEKGKKRIVR